MHRTHHTSMTSWQHRHVVARACTTVRTITASAIAANAAAPAAHAAWRNAASAAAVAAKRTARHLGPHTT